MDRNCEVGDCDRRATAAGMCEMHRKRWRKYGDPTVKLRERSYSGVLCSVSACVRPARDLGLCAQHAQRHRKYGDVRPGDPIRAKRDGMSAYARVMAMSHDDANGCRIFTGAKNDRGYGHLGDGGRTVYAHRVVLEYHLGPSDLPALHLCDVRACCNIAHLRYGSSADNTADMMRRKRAWWQKP